MATIPQTTVLQTTVPQITVPQTTVPWPPNIGHHSHPTSATTATQHRPPQPPNIGIPTCDPTPAPHPHLPRPPPAQLEPGGGRLPNPPTYPIWSREGEAYLTPTCIRATYPSLHPQSHTHPPEPHTHQLYSSSVIRPDPNCPQISLNATNYPQKSLNTTNYL